MSEGIFYRSATLSFFFAMLLSTRFPSKNKHRRFILVSRHFEPLASLVSGLENEKFRRGIVRCKSLKNCDPYIFAWVKN